MHCSGLIFHDLHRRIPAIIPINKLLRMPLRASIDILSVSKELGCSPVLQNASLCQFPHAPEDNLGDRMIADPLSQTALKGLRVITCHACTVSKEILRLLVSLRSPCTEPCSDLAGSASRSNSPICPKPQSANIRNQEVSYSSEKLLTSHQI